jgi:hypothetical protein
MVNIDTTLLHDLFQVTTGNAISHVEKHCVQDHAFGIMASLEIIRHRQRLAACLFKNHVAIWDNKRKTSKVCDRTTGPPQFPTHSLKSVSGRARSDLFMLHATTPLLRQYLRRRSDLSVHSQAKLSAIARQLNERPRKTLQYQTPAEKFAECVASIG